MQQFDVIVIGAGPAGSAAAAWAAQHSLTVALIDKAAFPRNKLCGGLFTERSRSYHREIFGQDIDLDQAVTKREIEFWHAGEQLAELRGVPPLHLTMRFDLDAALQARAIELGVQNFCGEPIAEIDGQTVTLKSGQVLQARVLIGADGVNSMVARDLFGRAFDHDTIGFGLEIEAPHDHADPRALPLRIDFGALSWGYGWSFPKQKSTTIGVGGMKAINGEIKTDLARYLTDLGLPTDAHKVKGHHLPFGDFKAEPGRGATLLAGDAAGLVDPITGEGIAFAMKSGQLAAQAAIDALAANAPEDALKHYRRHLKPMHRNLRIARVLRRIIFSRGWEPAFVSTFRRSGTVRHHYMALLAGQLEYPEIALKVLKRMPRFLIRRLRGAPSQ